MEAVQSSPSHESEFHPCPSLRSAVPADERDPKNWFLLPRPNYAERLYTAANLDAELDEFVVASSVDGAASWARAEGYYHRNMAQLQQLWQARQDFSKDLSLREVRGTTGKHGSTLWRCRAAIVLQHLECS